MLKKLLSSIFLTSLFCSMAHVLAQESGPPNSIVGKPISPEERKWETFGSAGDEFHARLPESPSVFSTYRKIKGIPAPGHARIYGTCEDGTVYLIVVYDKTRKEETFDYFVNDFKSRFLSSWETRFEYEITMNTDDGKHYSLKKGDITGAARFYVKPKHAYMIMAAGGDGDNAAIKRFLGSFTMWDYPIDKMRGPAVTDSVSAAVGDLSSGPTKSGQLTIANNPEQYVLPGIKSIVSPQSDTDETPARSDTLSGSVAPGNGNSTQSPTMDSSRNFEESEVTRKAFMILQPEPDYTREARDIGLEGVVKLKGVLSASGKVANISVIEGLPYGLTEKAIQAFRHLMFLPALKGDERVSQLITVEYSFRIN